MKAMAPCQDPSLTFHSVLTLLHGVSFHLVYMPNKHSLALATGMDKTRGVNYK